MQGLNLFGSKSHFIPQSSNAIDVLHSSRNLYSILQQESVQALKRESADMAVERLSEMIAISIGSDSINSRFRPTTGRARSTQTIARRAAKELNGAGAVLTKADRALAQKFLIVSVRRPTEKKQGRRPGVPRLKLLLQERLNRTPR